jgi:hypothetical protein
MKSLKEQPRIACEGCAVGRSMCEARACWGTPEEIAALMAAGYTNRLMLDIWVREYPGDIYIVCPAERGMQGQGPSIWPGGRCNMLTPEGLCEVHHMKPSEGAMACCKRSSQEDMHRAVAMTWDSDLGREVVARWKEEVGYGQA